MEDIYNYRSYGFSFHAYPYDFWRYKVEDMQKVFSDFEIIKLVRDHMDASIFMKARKPFGYVQNNLQAITLYSMIVGRRTASISNQQEIALTRKAKLFISKVIASIGPAVYRRVSK
jgi:hypothetical protein